jgi:hypothetical protein
MRFGKDYSVSNRGLRSGLVDTPDHFRIPRPAFPTWHLSLPAAHGPPPHSVPR